MDEGLFLFIVIFGLFFLCSIIYCFLSTCLGVQIRKADLAEAFSLPTPAKIRARDAERRRRAEAMGGYELDDLDRDAGGAYGRMGPMASSAEGFEMSRRGGPRGGYY
ncbi:hypothetical protein IAU60_001427 [Kwoniella sp. DSM 27419]